MRKWFGCLTLLALFGGCNSLKARMVAQQAIDLYHRGDVAGAAVKFEEAAALDSEIAPIQLDLGFANLALYQASPKSAGGTKAAEKAIAAFEKYLTLKPEEERASGYLVQTFIDTGRYDDAVAYFKPVLDKGGARTGEIIGTLGTIASQTGRFDEARKWYEKRIALDPQNSDARVALGVLLWSQLHSHADLLGPERLALCDTAQATLAESINLKPNAPDAYTYTNLVYRERTLAETTDDAKRIDLEQANKFFNQAQELKKAAAK